MLKPIWKFANSLRSDSANFQINAKSRPLSFSKTPANVTGVFCFSVTGLTVAMRKEKGGWIRRGRIGVRVLGESGKVLKKR